MPPFLGPKEQDVFPCTEMQETTGIPGNPMDTDTAEETPEEQALDKSWRQTIQRKRILQTFSRMNGFILTLLPQPPSSSWSCLDSNPLHIKP